MKMEDLIAEMMLHEELFNERIEQIPVGIEPIKKHSRPLTQKKWLKRWGYKTVYEEKKCKSLDVTLDLIINFCQENNLPLPEEMLGK